MIIVMLLTLLCVGVGWLIYKKINKRPGFGSPSEILLKVLSI